MVNLQSKSSNLTNTNYLYCSRNTYFIEIVLVKNEKLKHKVKNDNEYGSARFSTDREIKKNFKKESIYHIKEAGFPVSFSKNLKYIYFDRETPHYVYLGSTGSGKSVTAVIPTCTFISKAKKYLKDHFTDTNITIKSAVALLNNSLDKRLLDESQIDFYGCKRDFDSNTMLKLAN